MISRAFGPANRKVPVIGMGTWRLRDAEASATALRAGLDLGLTHVDTAELYEQQSRSESILKPVLAEYDREEIFLASKVLPSNASYEGTRRACEKSLKRLGTTYLDLFYLHWWSDAHPLADTMRAMERLVDEGKVRAIGVSNFDVEDVDAARAALTKHPLAANQVCYNLEAREPDARLIAHCARHKVAFVAYSPYSMGRFPSTARGAGKVLADVAARHGATPHQVALNYLARHENVFPIPKSEDAEHVRANAAALDFKLSAEDALAIDRAFPVPSDARLHAE